MMDEWMQKRIDFSKRYQENKEKKMISREELGALELVVAYILGNEYISFCEWVDEGGEPNDHIYGKAMMLDDFVRGVYSTGGVK